MAKKNRNNQNANRNSNPVSATAKKQVVESVVEVNNKNNNTDQEITMSTMNTKEAELAQASTEINNNAEVKKAIKAIDRQIKVVNRAISNRYKNAGNITANEKKALALDFQEDLVELNLQRDELTKKDSWFTAENTEAFGVATADKLADMVEKTPINSAISMVGQLKNRLGKK